MEDEISLRDFLCRLWSAMHSLTPRQAAVILLDMNTRCPLLAMFPALGIATAQEIARLMDMDLSTLADLRYKLPLADERVAEILRMSPQQVVLLRNATRWKLMRLMRPDVDI